MTPADSHFFDSNSRNIEVGSRVIYGCPPDNRLKEVVRTVRRHFHYPFRRAQGWRVLLSELWACRLGKKSYLATVVEITESEADWDDSRGCTIELTPLIIVRFDDGKLEKASTHNITRLTWGDYPDGPLDTIYEADDLEVVT